MADHRIRLRGAWEWHDGLANVGHRVSLPLERLPSRASPVRLVRAFNRPPIDRAREQLVLELKNVPGLISVSLNGHELVRPAPPAESSTIPLGAQLLARNILALEVRFHQETNAAVPPEGWGLVSLLIRPGAD